MCAAQAAHPSACDHRVAYTVPVMGLCRAAIFLVDPARDDHQRIALRHPAASASASVQNQRSPRPFAMLI
jgi:hypothetical protein